MIKILKSKGYWSQFESKAKLEQLVQKYKKANKLSLIELFGEQKLAYEAIMNREARIVCIYGGNRAGKTTVGAKIILDYMLRKPMSRAYCATIDLDFSVRIQQRKIAEFMPKSEVKYGFYDEVNGFRHKRILFKNGSVIYFKSYDQDAESFAGDDLDIVWNDEEPPYEHYTEEKIRLIDRKGILFFTMTPVAGVTQVVNEVNENNEIKKFHLKTYDNPHLDKTEIEEVMKDFDEQDRVARLTGVPMNKSGLVYPSFSTEAHMVDKLPSDNSWVYYQVLDPHDRKPWAMGWYAVNRIGDCYAIHEWPTEDFEKMKSDSRNIKEYADMIKAFEKSWGIDVQDRIIDPNFGNRIYRQEKDVLSVKMQLMNQGLYYMDGVDDLETGHQKVREYLSYDKLKPLGLNNKPKFFILRECRNHRYFMSHYSWDDYVKQEERSLKERPREKYKDYPDLIRYFLMSEPIGYVPVRGQYQYRKSA